MITGALILRQHRLLTVSLLCLCSSALWAQSSFFEPSDTFHKERFWITTGTGTLIYGGFSIALYNSWYRDYPRTTFHTFNDNGEWMNLDKGGHAMTAYNESQYIYYGARWTGMSNRSAAWAGAGVGMLLQSTVEVMDAFSAQWGFSWGDMAFNTAGAGLFLGQQLTWKEQRIRIKISQSFPRYSTDPIPAARTADPPTTLRRWTQDLYGKGLAERFLKDYNGMTIWLSVNPSTFLGDEPRIPRWLNVAVGYGADNVFGAHYNTWTDPQTGLGYSYRGGPRVAQWYLGLDVDLSRVTVRQRWLRYVLGVLNFIKVPSPVLVWSDGRLAGKVLYW